MFVYLWEYRVRPDTVESFLEHYGDDGAWASLFGRASGYLGTALLRDLTDPLRFITIDRWETADHYGEFRRRYGAEYSALDAKCDGLTLSEAPIGHFESRGAT
jgi:heme-degrading monooxygenase HmoA